MSRDSEFWTQRERSSTMASRRSDAMRRYIEVDMGHGHSLPPSKEFKTSVPPLPHRPATPPEHTDWLHVIDILKKHWRLSAAFALAVTMSVTVITLMKKPVFEPQARVEVDPPGAEVFSLQGNNNSGTATDYIETQAQNLQNDELTLEVIRKLHLDQSPYFGEDPNAVSSGPRLSTEVAVPLTPAENRALFVFKQSRTITRDVASRLITVSVSSHNPIVAATVTNTLVNMFIDTTTQFLLKPSIGKSAKLRLAGSPAIRAGILKMV